MKQLWINAIAMLVIAFGAHASTNVKASAALAYNRCEGGGQQCYCSGACSANSSGCTCH